MATNEGGVNSLLRLLSWMSPAFPVGAFSYSGGLERAVHDRLLTNAEDLCGWVSISLGKGTFWNDAVFLAQAWRTFGMADAIAETAELACALAGSAERYRETVLLGEAFVTAAQAWPDTVFDRLPKSVPYPVAVGSVAAAHGVGLEDVLAAYLHSCVSQIVSAGIRLGVCGQRDGVAVLAALEVEIAAAAKRAAASTLDDLGSATILADTASLRHETQTTRLFRS